MRLQCLLLASLLLVGCATSLESVVIPDPNSGLVVAYSKDQPGTGTIVEYVPVGETIDDWKHLLTIQFMEGEQRSPEEVASLLEQEVRSRGGTLTWTVLERDAHSMLYEWSLLDCPQGGPLYADQCELVRLLRGDDGLHRIAYTERGRSMDPEKRVYYLAAFRGAIVVEGEEHAPVAIAP